MGTAPALRYEAAGFASTEERGDGVSEEPLLRVVRGEPAEDELAALVAVVSAVAAAARAASAAEEQRASWSNPRALVRPPMSHGRGAWRASGLPG